MSWVTVKESRELPPGWDLMTGDNIFLKRDFLIHLEKVNPCRQLYSYLADEHSLKAIYVDYSLELDIFTYSFLSLKLPVRIMGIPCSVSKPGFAVCPGFESRLVSHFQTKKGLTLILNSDLYLTRSQGMTLPTCKLAVNWTSLNDYLLTMRSHYRYRLNKGLKLRQSILIEYLPLHKFDHQMYTLYEQVYNKSKAKLEKLSPEFFSRLPLPGKLIKASYQGHLLGFATVLENKTELIFLFVGLDYRFQQKFDTYLNLLLEIISYGIAKGFKTIDLGQTTEETKMKLGACLNYKSMYLSHSNPVLHALSQKFINSLSYKSPDFHFQVFK